MTQIPVLLPGMVPLAPQADLPGQAPSPTAGAEPFLALLAQLVGTPAAPGEPGKATPGPSGADADADSEPGDGDGSEAAPDLPTAEAPVLPALSVLPQLAAALAATAQTTAAPATAPKAAPGTKAGPAIGGAAPAAEAPVAEAPLPAAPAPAQQPATAPVAATTPVPLTAAPAVAPAAQVAAPAAAPAPAPVAHQVFPEVVRVAVTGETPKRVVVRLEPEHLGEVRVVLRTGRAGLEVSLAAGTDARAAIREGAPELRRMLEAAGSPDARILVRHLPDAPATAPVAAPTPTTPARTDAPTPLPGTSVDVGAGTAGGTAHGDRRDQPQQDAPPLATDGHHRPVEPARPTRASGLDVMM